ncbi:MAG: class I SAM-dependent methyltransferase [Saprospiraceae bacterium]|nr:class I SAM-dependent methyltransferase [Saprospiraceae bacterium]
MINTGYLTFIFRKFGLIHFTDKVKFLIKKNVNRIRNKKFKEGHPNIILPPDYMMFEAFKLDYEKYYYGGKEVAEWVINLVKKYKKTENIHILDWGCGPARVTRHLPDLLAGNSFVCGTDYNKKTIDWCAENVSNVNFVINGMEPPLTYEAKMFDVVISISIFTHLSEQNHKNWIEELYRIIKNDGILIVTTAGKAFSKVLTADEKVLFNSGKLVTRLQAKEGHRVFASFQPISYFKNLILNKFSVLELKEGTTKNWGIEQDYWVLKKN